MSLVKLKIGGVPEHFNLPWKMAIADGAFETANIEVEFIEYPGGTGAMNAALRSSELDAALLLTEGAVLDILNGSNNRLVSVFVDSSLVWGIHVAASGIIHEVDEIEGKRFAISRYGSGSHLIAAVDAAERGFETDDMNFVVVDNIDGARTAFANGTADVVLWEKHMTQPLVDSGEFRRIGERIVPWPAFVVSVRHDYLSASSDAVDVALNIVARYAEQLKAQSNAAELISKTYGIALDDAKSWLADVRWSFERRCPEAAIGRVITALESQGLVESPPRLDHIWATKA